jgi:hypothetical protein
MTWLSRTLMFAAASAVHRASRREINVENQSSLPGIESVNRRSSARWLQFLAKLPSLEPIQMSGDFTKLDDDRYGAWKALVARARSAACWWL